jgi:hypothetical protein
MSARHFGLSNMTARPDTAGQLYPTARHHAPPVEARCNLSSFAADPSFPRSPFTQAVIDVSAVIFAFLFVSVTALAIVGAFFIAFFVSV